MTVRNLIIILLAILCTCNELKAQDLNTDTTRCEYRFNGKQLIVPLAVYAGGVIGISAFPGFRRYVNRQVGKWGGSHSISIDNYLRFAPAVAYVGLGVCGVRSRNNLRDRLLAGATAYLCMGVATASLKAIVHEQRPDGSSDNSFPSGHAAAAFTGAELMRIEYGNAIGAAGYAVAAGVGILRLYNNRHWYNDVLAGAGIGILCARIGYWLLPFEKRIFKLDNTAMATVVPFYSQPERAVGVSMAMTL